MLHTRCFIRRAYFSFASMLVPGISTGCEAIDHLQYKLGINSRGASGRLNRFLTKRHRPSAAVLGGAGYRRTRK